MRAYIKNLTLVEDLLAIACQIITVLLNLNLLILSVFAHSMSYDEDSRKKRFQTRLKNLITKSTIVYLVTCILGSASGMGLVVYELVNYNNMSAGPNEIDDLYTFYWLGVFALTYFAISSISVFFLALERCFTLAMDLTWQMETDRDDKFKNRLAVASVCFIIFMYFGSVAMFLVELPLETDRVRYCITFSCMLLKMRSLPQVILKTCFASMNFILGIYFFCLVRRYSQFHHFENLIIGATLLLEIVFATIPNYASFVINLCTSEPVGNFLGPTMTTCLSVETAVCSVFCTYVLLRKETADERERSLPRIQITQ